MGKIVGIYINASGTLNICYPAENIYCKINDPMWLEQFSLDPNEGEKPGGWIQQWRIATIEEIVAHNIVHNGGGHEMRLIDSDILSKMDNYFRIAWVHQDGEIIVNMDKATEIHKGNLRVERNRLLSILDVQYMRADETGDLQLKIQIANRKQELRDITKLPEIENAKTPEELKISGISTLEKEK